MRFGLRSLRRLARKAAGADANEADRREAAAAFVGMAGQNESQLAFANRALIERRADRCFEPISAVRQRAFQRDREWFVALANEADELAKPQTASPPDSQSPRT